MPLLFVSHNSGLSNAEKQLMSVRSVVKPDVPLLASETLTKRATDDFTRWFVWWIVRLVGRLDKWYCEGTIESSLRVLLTVL